MKKISRVLLAAMAICGAILCCSERPDATAPEPNGNNGGADTTGPSVVFAYPGGEGAQITCEVSWSTPVVVAFSEPVDPASVTSSTFDVGLGKEGNLDICGNVVCWRPSLAFDPAVAIEVTVSGSIQDTLGNSMGTDYVFLFATRVEPG